MAMGEIGQKSVDTGVDDDVAAGKARAADSRGSDRMPSTIGRGRFMTDLTSPEMAPVPQASS